jgi:hypothetical protein
MFKKQTLLERLKKHHPYMLEELPEVVDSDAEEVALKDSTLDQIAFSILALEAEIRPLSRRLNALRDLYDLARKRGALGAHRIGDIFSNEEDHS